ncbi:MAG: CsiV family protein [Pseudomonadota bacterium]
MPQRIGSRLTLASLLLSSWLVAGAQDPVGDEEPVEIKRYTVELIVFAYNENVSLGTEVFPPDPPPEPLDEAPEPLAEDDEDAEPTSTSAELDERLTTIFHSRADFKMQEEYGHLRRLDVYKPLMHVSWTQAGLAEDVTEPMDISVFGSPPDDLSGSFKLYLGNYLHLVVDLEMLAPGQQNRVTAASARPQYSDEFSSIYDEPIDGPVVYRIQEDRIIRNGETRYFDHPKFGVIAKVDRVEEEELETDEAFLLPAQ